MNFDSCFERFSEFSPSNAKCLLSSNTRRGAAHETIRMWIKVRQKMVISGPALAGKSRIIAKALEEFVQSGSYIQRFYWDGLVPMSDSIDPEDLEFVQLDILRNFYSFDFINLYYIPILKKLLPQISLQRRKQQQRNLLLKRKLLKNQ